MSLSNEVNDVISITQRKVEKLEGLKKELNVQLEIINSAASNCQETDRASEKLTNLGYQIDYMIDRYNDDVNYYVTKETLL